MKKLILITVLLMSVLSCGHKEAEDEPSYRYTIYLGEAGYSLGMETNSYTTRSKFISFTNDKGYDITTPINRVYYIKTNKTN